MSLSPVKLGKIVLFKEAYQAFLEMQIVLGIKQVLNKYFGVREQRIIIRAL